MPHQNQEHRRQEHHQQHPQLQLQLQQRQEEDRAATPRQSSADRVSLQDHFDKLELSSTCSSSSSSSYGSGNGGSSRKIKVTLLYRKADNFILYMEAGKDFVDLLLSFLTLPIGTAMKLLRDGGCSKPSGGMANIYESLLELDESLLYVDKEPLLCPKPVETFDLSIDLLRPGYSAAGNEIGAATPKRSVVYYKCCNHGCLRFVIDLPGQICPVCKFAMSHKLELIQPKGSYPPSPVAAPTPSPRRKEKLGYARKNRTFIVTDSLQILPLSSITGVILLSKLNLDSIKDLESCQVCVGIPEVLELLRASFSSQTALNDVFGSKKK